VINIGVGQGTILGPTFFKIYIMDLHLHTCLFLMKFADDSTFVGSGNTRDAVQSLVNSELEKISKWFKDNQLTLHPNKSKYLIHSRDKLMAIRLDNVILERSGYGMQEESVKLLGVEIDENLDWKRQVQSIIKKINKGNYLLWRHGKKLSVNMQKTIFESFVRCHILYGLTVWGGASKTIIKPLQTSLSKVWSKIGNRKMHTLNRLEKYGLLKLEDEIRIQESKVVWKWINDKTAPGIKHILTEKQDNLRGRRFVIKREWKVDSISRRIATRANKEVPFLSKFKTKVTMTKNLKSIINTSYVFHCRNRNCFVCGHRMAI